MIHRTKKGAAWLAIAGTCACGMAAAPARAQMSEGLSGADRLTLDNERIFSGWQLTLERYRQSRADYERGRAERARQRSPEFRRRQAQGKRIIAAGKASLRYTPGQFNSSPVVAAMARELAKDREAAREVTKSGTAPELRVWLAKRLQEYPQVLRRDPETPSYDPRNVADALAMCTLLSWMLATGHAKDIPDAQARTIRDTARRNLLRNAIFQSYGAGGRRQAGDTFALMTSLMTYGAKRIPSLSSDAKVKEARELRSGARDVFRLCVGDDASKYHITDKGLMPVGS